MAAPQPGAPGILALADLDRLRKLITGAGFSEPRIDEVRFSFSFADDQDYWDFLLHAAGVIAMVLERLDEDEVGKVREELARQEAPSAARAGSSSPPSGTSRPRLSPLQAGAAWTPLPTRR